MFILKFYTFRAKKKQPKRINFKHLKYKMMPALYIQDNFTRKDIMLKPLV